VERVLFDLLCVVFSKHGTHVVKIIICKL
jgi:hypothetical protein